MSNNGIINLRKKVSKSKLYRRNRNEECFEMCGKYMEARLLMSLAAIILPLLITHDKESKIFLINGIYSFVSSAAMYTIHFWIKRRCSEGSRGRRRERGYCILYVLFVNIFATILASNENFSISIAGYFSFILEYVYCSFNVIRNFRLQLVLSFPFIAYFQYLGLLQEGTAMRLFSNFFLITNLIVIYRSHYEENILMDKYIYKTQLMKEKAEIQHFMEHLPISIINYNGHTHNFTFNKRMEKSFAKLGSNNYKNFARKTVLKKEKSKNLKDVVKEQIEQFKLTNKRRKEESNRKEKLRKNTEDFLYLAQWEINDIRNGGLTPLVSPHTPREILLEIHFYWKSKEEDSIIMIIEEKSKKQQEKEEKIAMKCKSVLTRAMSHNLKTPLNCLLSFLTCDKGPITYEDKLLMKMSATFLEYKIEDTIEFSKIEAGIPSNQKVLFRLDELFDYLCNLCILQAKLESVFICRRIDKEVANEIYGPKKQITQILLHLLQNAIKYSHKEGTIILFGNVTPRDKTIVVGVEDFGQGIPAEYLPKIFNFLNIGEEGSSKKKSNLIDCTFGLPLTQEIARSINSPLQVESKAGKGTKFFMRLTNLSKSSKSMMATHNTDTFSNFSAVIEQRLAKNQIVDKENILSKKTNSNLHLADDLNLISPTPEKELNEKEREDYYEGSIEEHLSPMAVRVNKSVKYNTPTAAVGRELFTGRHNISRVMTNTAIDLPRAALIPRRSLTGTDVGEFLSQRVFDTQPTPLKSYPLLVLSVDDNGLNRLVLKRLLEKKGVKVIEASNGKEALEVILDKQLNYTFDFIFMDLNMPIMDGIEATQEIKALVRKGTIGNMPIFAITAHESEQVKEKCIHIGFDEYLTKPIRSDEIDLLLHNYEL